MIWHPRWHPLRWIARSATGSRDARRHLRESEEARRPARLLVEEVRRLSAENHITARVHAAMRGGR